MMPRCLRPLVFGLAFSLGAADATVVAQALVAQRIERIALASVQLGEILDERPGGWAMGPTLVPLIAASRRDVGGCACRWPDVTFWKVFLGVPGGTQPTFAAVGEDIYPLALAPQPQIGDFLNALVESDRATKTPPTISCLVEVLIRALDVGAKVDFPMQPTEEYDSVLVARLNRKLPSDWPSSGLRELRGDTVAVFTLYRLLPIAPETLYRPIAYSLLFDSQHKVVAWREREASESVAP